MSSFMAVNWVSVIPTGVWEGNDEQSWHKGGGGDKLDTKTYKPHEKSVRPSQEKSLAIKNEQETIEKGKQLNKKTKNN